MKRITVFQLLNATTEILGKPEIKSSLTGKQIYSISKLDRKLETENKRTAKLQAELQKSMQEANAKDGITDEEKKEVNTKFKDDWQGVWDEEVENPIEVKIPFESSERILQNISKADVTTAVIEHLIEQPE